MTIYGICTSPEDMQLSRLEEQTHDLTEFLYQTH